MVLNPYLKLETKGRRTGLPHIVELRYVWLGESYYVLAGSVQSDWVKNMQTQPLGRVRLGEFMIDVAAAPADEHERAMAVSAFESKYGPKDVRRWYPRAGPCLRLAPMGPASRRGESLGELGAKKTYADWVSEDRDYRAEVANAFDLAAVEYDFTISRNFINTWIRRRSLGILKRLVRRDDLLLEVGCGTGTEALEVASWASGVVATDLSPRMTELVRAKSEARGMQGRVVPLTIAAADIIKVRDSIGPRRIRVGYSFNGALNCEPRLASFVSQLHGLLEPGGYFVCSVRNTTCASEMVSHGLALQFSKATPRRSQPTMVSVGGVDIPSTYFSPSEFISYFEPHFVTVQTIGLPAFLPPAYLNEYYLRVRRFSSLLERLELLLSGTAPFNRLGDQTLFVLRRSQ